jgi:ABC-type proline/glycine betaine transport system substrate-binding protein
VDKNLVQHLIIQNILLKKALAEKNPSAAQFLEDIDLMLQELANMESDDEQTLSMIRELIQKRDILFKMEILQKI